MANSELPSNVTEGIYKFARGMYESSQRRAEEAKAQKLAENLRAYETYKAPGGLPYGNEYDPQKNPSGFIRRLIDEVGDQDFSDLPASDRAQQFDRPPLVAITQRVKTPTRMNTDYKQRQMMDRMLSAYGVPESPGVSPPGWAAIDKVYDPDTAKSIKDTLHAYVMDRDSYRSNLRSSMEDSGFLGESAPLNTAMTWAQALPSMLYGVGEEVSAFVDPEREKAYGNPERPKTLRQAWNTFSAPLQAPFNPDVPADHSAWSAMKAARDAIDSSDTDFTSPHRDYSPEGTVNDAVRYANLDGEMAADPLRRGIDYFNDTLRWSPSFGKGWGAAGTVAGHTADALFNPYFEAGGMTHAINKLPHARPLLRQLLTEFGLDYGIMAANALPDNHGNKVRSLLPSQDWSK